MSLTTATFYTSGIFSVTASTSIGVSCWGAGGDGSKNGNGGSGGSYCDKIFIIQSGSYTVNVGTRNYDGLGNGGASSFVSASVIVVRAAGGRSDGTITGQTTYNTGSQKYTGGLGGVTGSGYGNYSGGGGGSAAGGLGAGITGNAGADDGASFSTTGHPFTGSSGASGAAAGGGNGGNSAYYDAGPCSRLIYATDGDLPGGGGGGGYRGETNLPLVTEGNGGNGMVTINY